LTNAAEKNYGEAIDWFSKAIDVHPTAVVYSNRAFAHIKLEEYGSAIQDATEAITLDPAYIKVLPLPAR
jgi:serine/threonine-protein phosphatase 5